MSRRFFELAVRVRRFVARTTDPSRAPRGTRLTARRQLGGGGELTQFSFRLAFIVDLAYVGIGALGGAAVGRGTSPATSAGDRVPLECRAGSTQSTDQHPPVPNDPTTPAGRPSGSSIDHVIPGVIR